MADVRAHAEVRLWGEVLGAVAELASGRVVFEYAESFRRRGLEVSPVHLPADLAGPRRFDELLDRPGFRGLPGVLADALPDAFGDRVQRAYFAARGQPERADSPVERLLHVGQRALGALSFHPAEELPPRPGAAERLDVAQLVREVRRVLSDEPDPSMPELYRIGASAGGMRPKAIVLHDPATGSVRPGDAPPRDGEVPCILKIDGVGTGAGPAHQERPLPFNRMEAAYGRMARAAGLDTAEISVLEENGLAHLLVQRFDVEGGERVHQHTLGGLTHVDHHEPGTSSYETYLRTILRLGMPYASLEQGYRRMVFNVLAVNQDDHVKNLSFQLRPEGRWDLAPAYDLTFARGDGWTAKHQMRVAGKTSGIREHDLLRIAEELGIQRPGRILERTRDALADWESFARSLDVPTEAARTVRKALDRRAGTLATRS